MSFRAKLGVFFALVVVVPMLATAFVLLRLVGDNEAGKADARLASREAVAVNLSGEVRRQADVLARRVARDPLVLRALKRDDHAALARRFRVLERRQPITRMRVVRRGVVLADAGDRAAVFPTLRTLVTAGGVSRGTLSVSTVSAATFAQRVRAITALDAIVAINGRLAGATLPVQDGVELPGRRGTVAVSGRRLRAASFDATGIDGSNVRVTVVEPSRTLAVAKHRSRWLVVALLLGFFALAVTLGIVVSRSLGGQLQRFLHAARQIGAGDFSARVYTQGRDDLAQLGDEFNKMASQLAERVDELRVERERLRDALRRTGTAVAANLDRDGLLDVVMTAAVDGVGADAGRATVRTGADGELRVAASCGDDAWLDGAMQQAEHIAFQTGEPAEVAVGSGSALARPLAGRDGAPIAVLSIARSRSTFSADERELLDYLAVQAAASIENVLLHERAEHQAVTDGLTGLANRRHFEERLASEVERTRRFPAPVGLMMLDIDHFKRVNDRYGHQAGDEVLRAVADALAVGARDIDTPSRYGGEEMAVLLPGADVAGAMIAAERARTVIESLDTGVHDEHGDPVRVTVSIGVAALGEGPVDGEELIAAADAALYRAKRAGRNRSEAASPAPVA